MRLNSSGYNQAETPVICSVKLKDVGGYFSQIEILIRTYIPVTCVYITADITKIWVWTVCVCSMMGAWVFIRDSAAQKAQVPCLGISLSGSEEGFEDKRKWESNLDWQTSLLAYGRLLASLEPLSVTADMHSSPPKSPGRRDSRTASCRVNERKFKCRVSSQVADSCWLMKAEGGSYYHSLLYCM